MKKQIRTQWTQEEINLLYQLYPFDDCENLVLVLHHPLSSIQDKACNLGIKRQRHKKDVIKSFWDKVNKLSNIFGKSGQYPTECWRWLAATKGPGYGQFYNGDTIVGAHVFSYELIFSKITKGMTIDHLCRYTSCVNPFHMEIVSRGENVLRGNTVSARAKKATYCPSGHAYSLENTYIRPNGHRVCKECCRIRSRNARKLKNVKK